MRILIVEDEAVAARGLSALLREILGARVESIRVEKTLIGSVCFIEDSPVDLLLLDLNLHGEDGFDVLKEAAAGSFQTIVVSGNTDKALEAFEFGVVDFVPKPVVKERLGQALERLEKGSASGRVKYLCVKDEDFACLIDIADIRYLESSDNYVRVHLASGAIERHRKSLDALQRFLPGFTRIHRRFAVPVASLKQIRVEAGGRYRLVLDHNTELPVSRQFYRKMQSAP